MDTVNHTIQGAYRVAIIIQALSFTPPLTAKLLRFTHFRKIKRKHVTQMTSSSNPPFNLSLTPFGRGDVSITGLTLAFESPCQSPPHWFKAKAWHCGIPSQSNPCCIIQHCSQTCLIKDPGHGPWLRVWGFEWQICCQLSTNRHRPSVSPSFSFSFGPFQTWQQLAPAPVLVCVLHVTSISQTAKIKATPRHLYFILQLIVSWNRGFLFSDQGKKFYFPKVAGTCQKHMAGHPVKSKHIIFAVMYAVN